MTLPDFTAALQASADRATFAGGGLERYLDGLHLEDLALACGCAAGHDAAWEHFILELRPPLYRAADTLDPAGGARELVDALYGDLYGTEERDGQRRSLFRYFHGRSSLATWLRAVLAQRYVDALRARRRLEPLADDDQREAAATPAASRDPECARFVDLIQRALAHAVASLAPRDRLRLACYYTQQLTLAETGRLLGEHEATASRHLARTRRAIRTEVERHLRTAAGLSEDQIARCFECALEDSGPIDLGRIIRKDSPPDRSI